LADNDPTRIEGYIRMSVLEYFYILDSKIAENKKAASDAKAKERRR
jgi:hypothetical protein